MNWNLWLKIKDCILKRKILKIPKTNLLLRMKACSKKYLLISSETQLNLQVKEVLLSEIQLMEKCCGWMFPTREWGLQNTSRIFYSSVSSKLWMTSHKDKPEVRVWDYISAVNLHVS